MQRQDAHTASRAILDAAGQIILGKETPLKLALACLLARGHLLIEDMPGVGKTTLAHTLARLLGLDFQRIQFTSDMLPADIIGVSVFERGLDNASGVTMGGFRFHPGPIFAQLILADEVNRATPKAQSALLEAMEERQVTTEGITRPLPEPFFVIATQNPTHQIGTFPLPESQLDRFLMRIELGYPGRDAERALLAGSDRRQMVAQLSPLLAAGELRALQEAATAVHASPALIDYVQTLADYSRNGHFTHGLSPRAALGLLAAARAWALIEGRTHVLPEDVQAVLPGVVAHRLHGAGFTAGTIGRHIIEAVPLP
ncbi:MAG TPA: AAA family ATPase [Rhodocyclaceae bacterium]|jgi:MoxR-like ATPase|nr:AAA family ATPase [Rhodocyclaceae bacterium]